MPVLMVAAYNQDGENGMGVSGKVVNVTADERVMVNGKISSRNDVFSSIREDIYVISTRCFEQGLTQPSHPYNG